MFNVLIVWQEIPDETCFVHLEGVSVGIFNELISYHNKYINTEDISEENQTKLNNFFFDEKGKFKFQKTQKFECGTFNAVILTGIML